VSEKTGVCAPKGFKAAGVPCGLKANDALDVAVIIADRPANVAGVFTTNLVCGAPVTISRKHVADGVARAIVVNAGNANACTGVQGEQDAVEMCRLVADGIGCDPHEVVVASTGVIGRQLPMDLISPGINTALDQASDTGGEDAARAILTTDTVPKTVVRSVEIDGVAVTIGGMAKGAGMIAPRLATMLSFITTDAACDSIALDATLRSAVESSFNRVTVDGDTSTSDMVVILANGAAENKAIVSGSPGYEAFSEALAEVCGELARMIATDGEGATKFVTVHVTGAANASDAQMAVRSVAESPLVKTAVFGGDPNWGRIAAALGRSGATFDPNQLRIWIDDLLLFEDGMPTSFELAQAEKRFAEKVLTICADLGAGDVETEMYTCDYSYDYIRINAEYTT
jgi:glutamate N-acetyltransferase / amino-acid N-acetyltransferase